MTQLRATLPGPLIPDYRREQGHELVSRLPSARTARKNAASGKPCLGGLSKPLAPPFIALEPSPRIPNQNLRDGPWACAGRDRKGMETLQARPLMSKSCTLRLRISLGLLQWRVPLTIRKVDGGSIVGAPLYEFVP